MAALSWSYLLWTIKLIWREAPKKIGSWVRFSGMTFFFVCVLSCKSCEILRTAWGRLTFAVECHVARCQFRDDHHFSFTLVCPCFMCKKKPMKTEVRMLHWAVYTIQAKRKARSGAQDDALDCCIQFTWWEYTVSSTLSGRPGPASLHVQIGWWTHVNGKARRKVA